ncbi:MAG: hypothetical protein PVF83_11470 [Anaerolineales bacterium]|jgi:hypothetical protein
MKTFGDLLRYFRRQCKDPVRGGMLTQERLGELIGLELGDAGYTGGAIGEWERDKSKISQDNYSVLVALVKVLVKCGGIRTPADADELLVTGNYRPLNETERIAIFGMADSSKQLTPESGTLQRVILSPFKELQFRLQDEWQYIAGLLEKPTPHLSTVFWDWLGHLGERVSIERGLRSVIWVSVCLLTWALVFPIMRWPFAGEPQTELAVYAYIAGSLVLPLIIGGLSRTIDSDYWKQQGLAQLPELRLYTHQGAFIGFHLGFTAIFFARLFLHYLALIRFPHWVEGVAAIFILWVSYSVARQVPFNLWRAYRRLRLRDGAVFFIFVFFGPVFGAFFFKFHDIFLSLKLGLPLIITAVLTLLILQVWQRHRTGSSVIPAHIWATIFGAFTIIYQTSISTRLYPLIVLSSIMAAVVSTLAWASDNLTFPKALFGFLIPASLIVGLWFNLWIGVGIGLLTIGVQQYYNKLFWIPWGFWGVMIASILGEILIIQHIISEDQASAGMIFITVLVLWLMRQKYYREMT